MPLATGTRVGPYEVTAPLGVGGMGEVFRARDTKLGRDVALKVLPEAFASQTDRLSRFRREAQVLAALNHPNIAAIFGLEEASGSTALVLELVEGPTLAERLHGGAIPIEEALLLAKQIAEALEGAHQRGIMHRDLKPANIKITGDGKVKVLDFGLAKILGEELLNPALSTSPTLMSNVSVPGTILGTAAYMSPEQARGKTVDKRTDVWAFGVVLFEMLTGRQVFSGETATDVLGAIVHKEPDWAGLPAQTPAALRRLLRRCLAKDAHQRLHDIADARLEIEAAAQDPTEGSSHAGGVVPSWKRDRRSLAVAGLAIGILAFVGGMLWTKFRSGRAAEPRAGSIVAPTTHTVIDLPSNALLALGSHIPTEGFDSPVVALSPDGTKLAFIGQSGSETMLYLRSMSGSEVKPVPGTEGAIYAFFSPDSQWLGLLTNDKVKKVSLQGGAPRPLADARSPVLAWWTRNNGIYFTQNETSRLSRVSEDGGEVGSVFEGNVFEYGGVGFTDVLPDGTAALADDASNAGISRDYSDIVLLSPRTKEKKLLVRSGYGGRYVFPGYLVFARAGALLAVRFNVSALEVEGEPFPIASDVSMESLFGQVHYSVSNNGMLAYVPGGERAIGKLTWVDRKANAKSLDAPARVYGVFDLSPAGNRLAVHVADVKDYVWIYDLERREGRQLAGSEHNGWPIWRTDNLTIALTSFTKAGRKILVRRVDEGAASKDVDITNVKDPYTHASSWSPGGDELALSTFAAGVSFVTLDGNSVGFTSSGHSEWGPEFSPDGRWVAYNSQETGRTEIVVRSYPDGKITHQISVDGGIEPVWCPCGELFFRKGNQWLSTPISTQPELRWAPPRLVFETDFIDTNGRSYDVSPDGQRLLVVKRAAADVQTKLHLITNWYGPPL